MSCPLRCRAAAVAVVERIRSAGGVAEAFGADVVDEDEVPGMTAYVAAKNAQIGLTKVWAKELGPADHRQRRTRDLTHRIARPHPAPRSTRALATSRSWSLNRHGTTRAPGSSNAGLP
jgi:NAD(P)-dependent dehydrogenase (short-subunit alcohol dehydrogenase family)